MRRFIAACPQWLWTDYSRRSRQLHENLYHHIKVSLKYSRVCFIFPLLVVLFSRALRKMWNGIFHSYKDEMSPFINRWRNFDMNVHMFHFLAQAFITVISFSLSTSAHCHFVTNIFTTKLNTWWSFHFFLLSFDLTQCQVLSLFNSQLSDDTWKFSQNLSSLTRYFKMKNFPNFSAIFFFYSWIL